MTQELDEHSATCIKRMVISKHVWRVRCSHPVRRSECAVTIQCAGAIPCAAAIQCAGASALDAINSNAYEHLDRYSNNNL